MASHETWTLLKVLNWTKGYLLEKGVENARLEAEWLLCAATGLDRVGLYVNFEKPLSDEELGVCRSMVARRAKREPLQYILGSQEFCGLDFEVAPGVLIPRHDTEVLVDEAKRRGTGAKEILDIGCGSGCIAVSLAKSFPEANVYGVDSSSGALSVAQRNVERHSVGVKLFYGSLFEPFAGKKFDLIVSNPPYIPTKDLETLQPEVKEFEPKSALDGGKDGLDFYRKIIPTAIDYLNASGHLIFEVGINQAEEVMEIFRQTGAYSDLFSARDSAGIERVVGGKFN